VKHPLRYATSNHVAASASTSSCAMAILVRHCWPKSRSLPLARIDPCFHGDHASEAGSSARNETFQQLLHAEIPPGWNICFYLHVCPHLMVHFQAAPAVHDHIY